MRLFAVVGVVSLVALGSMSRAPLSASPQIRGGITKGSLEGVRNYTKVDATIGCAGATDPDALATIARLGYRAVLNLRLATEDGVALEESRAAAKEAELIYIHLPFKGSDPDATVADAFLKEIANPANQPVFIHCGSANRVGSLWLIKRMLVDGWPQERAVAEAKAIGLTSDALEAFALDYVSTHRYASTHR